VSADHRTLARLTARIARAPGRTALCMDFDGVLAPIVEDPASAAMTEGLAPVLEDLAGALGALALISGRPAAFLADRAASVYAAGGHLLGLYGLERWHDGAARPHADAAVWHGVVAATSGRLARHFAAGRGILVEDKGLGVAVHWRNAGTDAERAAAGVIVDAAVREEAEATGLEVAPGKFVLELRPPVAWDKGDGVRTVAADSGAELVVYAGDDIGDLPAFAAVRALGGTTIAIDHGTETDPRVLQAGDAILAGPPAVASWLGELRSAVRAGATGRAEVD